VGARARLAARRRRGRQPPRARRAPGRRARLRLVGHRDPACDVVIAWTFLSGASRDRFREELDVDAATWSRGRGWALWKALITLVGHLERDSPGAAAPRRDIEQVIADYARDG
jgi:aminoglycoside phosphotransferase (APT) family kinase protein